MTDFAALAETLEALATAARIAAQAGLPPQVSPKPAEGPEQLPPPAPAPAPAPKPVPEAPVYTVPDPTVPEVPPPDVGPHGWIVQFNNGLEGISRAWGHVWVHDDRVTVSSWAGEKWQASGAMQAPTGAAANQGFGVYTIRLRMGQTTPGAYACLWPSTDKWPGPELDIVEAAYDGAGPPYSTVHWKGEDGSNQYTTYPLPGLDVTGWHTYSLDWRQGLLVLSVDGTERWRCTEHVPNDASTGGENAAFGVGTLVPADIYHLQQGDCVIEVAWMAYQPHG